jgi:predicted ATPase/DNA-binding SARP family transcriptional activator
VEYRILGPLEMFHAGVSVVLGGPRHRALLAVLLVHAGEVVSAARLIHALWGDEPPKTASALLHVRIAELRGALRGGRPERSGGLLTRGSGYLLQIGRDELDAARFEELAATGRQALTGGDYQRASTFLREALALWRGPALADVADEPFARAEVTRLEALRVQAMEDRLEADLALGLHGEVVVELEGLVAEHPLRERFWCQFMLALYGAGRQGEALRAYQAVRELLIDRLGVEPGVELQRRHTAILRQDPALAVRGAPVVPAVQTPPNNLSTPLTSFLGRDRELAEVRALLQVSRLVTVTGVGGAGKSRLAVEAATAWLPDHPDGTWIVELAALFQPGLVVPAVAATLGVREHPDRSLIEVLADRLRAAQVLLVLDNCEHLVGEVADVVQRLLGACPRLQILVTSRERLGITGEVLQPMSGLTVPAAGVSTASAVGRAAAVQLLVARACAVAPGFNLSDTTAAAVAQICQRLDGLPLAIELAAARANALDVAQIAARLDDRFRLLTQGSRTARARHQTLRAVVDWSYGLLSEPQRRLFDRLSVFVSGFTLEAAEAICATPGGRDGLGPDAGDGDEAVAELLAALVNKSLVTTETAAAEVRRYGILENLRAYALERLDNRGETAVVRGRHSAFFLAFVGSAGAAVGGHKQPAWLERLEAEHGNLRAALAWALEQGDTATAVPLAGSLYPFWNLRGHYTEGRRWLDQALAAEGAVPPAARMRALVGAATLAVIQGDLHQATVACEQAAELSRRVGDPTGLSHALRHLGFAALHRGELDLAVTLLEESLRHARTAHHRWMEGWSLVFLAVEAVGSARYDRAATLAAECESVLRTVNDPEGLAWALTIRGSAMWRVGDRVAAAGPLREGMRKFQSLRGRWGLSFGLLLSGLVAGARGDHEQLTVLLSASEALRASIGAALLPFVKAWLDDAITQASTALDAETFNRAWQAGQTMTPDHAIADAMRELDLAANGAATSD